MRKRLFLFAIGAVLLTTCSVAHAQWTVFDPVADGYYLPEQQLATLDVVGQNVEQNVNWISQLQHFRGSAQRPTGHHRERNLSGSRSDIHNRAIDVQDSRSGVQPRPDGHVRAATALQQNEDHPNHVQVSVHTTR
jgi:hypothetical protein